MLGGSRPTGRHRARCWWTTRALPAERSRPRWPAWSLASWVPLAATNPTRGSFRTGCDSGRGDHLDLKHQLGLDRHGGGIPAGLWARVVQRLLALNTAIWFNWQIGAPTKRSLIAYDHYHPLHQHRKPHQRSRAIFAAIESSSGPTNLRSGRPYKRTGAISRTSCTG
jgi:hypothetical protein